MHYLMSIDAGTGSIRAVVFNENADELGSHQIEWSHKEEQGVLNSMNFDYDYNWSLVKKTIINSCKDASINPNQIEAITSSSMREGIVLYDKFDKEIWAVANVDARADKEVRHLKESFDGIEERFYNISGQTFALGALPRVLWLKNNRPNIYQKVAKISMLSDWILYKLSNIIVSEPSNAGTSGIFSLKRRNWETKQAKEVGLKDNIFPPIYESGEVVGNIASNIVDELGLASSCKIVMGGGDVQLGSLGLGLINIGDSAILGGSFWQQIVNIDANTTPPSNMDIRVNPHVVVSQSQAEGITFFSGLIMRWFRDVFGNGKSYTQLEMMAKDIPIGSNGILPIFSDSMKYGKWYHASPSFLNLNIDPTICNVGSMFRSLQENAAIVSKINLEKIEHFSKISNDTIIFAAGASKSKFWSQMLSDVLAKKVKVPVVKEATALGGAIYCAVAVGAYNTIEDAVKIMVKYENEFVPNMDNHKEYQKIEDRFIKAYKAQLKLVDDGICESMWKAPGS